MNYGIPAFALFESGMCEQQLVMAGYAKHVGFYPHPEVIQTLAGELGAYTFAKGWIPFPLDVSVPEALMMNRASGGHPGARSRRACRACRAKA